jgi:hypothetical protein
MIKVYSNVIGFVAGSSKNPFNSRITGMLPHIQNTNPRTTATT